MSYELEITPEPSPSDREAILRATAELLRRESDRARPCVWSLAGWSQRRTGISDLGRFLPPERRWALSARMPWGGREYSGRNGRGDTK